MRTILHILSFEWKTLWRSNTLKVLMLVTLGAGIYGIYFGKFEIDKQNERIAFVKDYEREKFDSLLVWARLDTTITENKEKYEQAVSPQGVGYTLHFAYCIANQPAPTAGLCLGQRDLYPSYYRITMTDLSRQMNTGELANPMKLLTGNFDLSYVFVFLFPLLIIALFYNLYAGEKEGGTLSLLQSQSVPLRSILLSKALMRMLVVFGLAFLLLVLGFVLQGITLGDNSGLLFQWLVVVFGYCLVWMILMGAIVALRRSSALSAMLGFGLWLIFTLITPTLINLFVLANEPLPNRTTMIHELREESGKNWDNPKSYVLNQFYQEKPEFNDGDSIDFYKWYYASFAVLDLKAKDMKAGFEQQVNKRNTLLEKWMWLAPAAIVHNGLSKLSNTDSDSQKDFMREVEKNHTELKNIYYTRIFAKEQFSIQDLENIERRL